MSWALLVHQGLEAVISLFLRVSWSSGPPSLCDMIRVRLDRGHGDLCVSRMLWDSSEAGVSLIMKGFFQRKRTVTSTRGMSHMIQPISAIYGLESAM